jgi:trafficking protein particle complex subunit 11
MFGSATTLPARTKRWAEAKVLADSMNVKICKLYLYNAEHSLALLQHNAHVRKFSDLSRGWGIGEETFEFWSWVARQCVEIGSLSLHSLTCQRRYRVLAELLEQGTRSTLAIPTHAPIPAATALGHKSTASLASLPPSARSVLEPDALRALGINPSVALQHPGFYYYMAARCTEKRRSRYLAALDTDVSGPPYKSASLIAKYMVGYTARIKPWLCKRRESRSPHYHPRGILFLLSLP